MSIVPTPTDKTETPPDDYATMADSLDELAAHLRNLAGTGLPKPLISVAIQFTLADTPDFDEQKIQAIDTIAGELLGHPGKTQAMSGGSFHHTTRGRVGAVNVSVFDQVSSPEVRQAKAELERLRAELAALRAHAGGES